MGGGTGGCQVISNTLDVDISAVTLSGSITVNGAPPVTEGLLRLKAGEETAVIYITSGTYSAEIFRGTYEMEFSLDTGTSLPVPLGRSVTIDKALTLDIDVPTVTVSGNLTLNGQPPSPGNLHPYIVFRASNGGQAAWAALYTGTYSVELVPGTYDVLYSNRDDDGETPQNQDTVFLGDVTLDADRHLDLDVPMVTLSLHPEEPSSVAGRAFYVTTDDGGFGHFSNYTYGEHSARLIPASYDLRVQGAVLPGTPNNYRAEPIAHVTLDDSKTLELDMPVVTISGEVTLNGAPAPVDSGGTIYLVGSPGNVQIASLSSATYSANIVAGTYDVVYVGPTTVTDGGSTSDPNDGVPDNPAAVVLKGVELMTSRTLDIDVAMAVVTGRVGVNGAPAELGREGWLYLAPTGGVGLLAATTADTSYRAELVVGTYSLGYTRFGDDTVNGVSVGGVLSNVPIDGNRTLDLDVPLKHLSGSITLNGAPPPNNYVAILWLLGPSGYADISGGPGIRPVYSSEVPPGTYDVRYSNSSSGPGFPFNQFARLGCVRMP